ncbi:MAG: hypothetical protein WD276_01355 [Actinomycetota bacterium]
MTRESRDGIAKLLDELTPEELGGYHDRPIPDPLDQAVSRLVQALADETLGEREQILGSWFDTVQLGALSVFCVRMASLAVREDSSDLVLTGLLAAAFEGFRENSPDGGRRALAAAYDAAVRVGGDPGTLFAQAASLARPEMAGHLQQFLRRDDLDAATD